MIRYRLKQLIKKELAQAQKMGLLPKSALPEIEIESPVEKKFGDYSTNIAMRLAHRAKQPPLQIAQILFNRLLVSPAGRRMFSRLEIKGLGFLNFFLTEECLQNCLIKILKQKDKFGNLKIGQRQKVQVEFISANPTGPLTLGNGRGAFLGDVLTNVLRKAGYRAEREYYINDVGEQIIKLGHSVLGDEQAVYQGDYMEVLKKEINEKEPLAAGQAAARFILARWIKPLIEKKLKIKFDAWFSEKALYQSGAVDKTLDFLKNKKLTYKQEGALWFKTTAFGDDKDRVLIKADGEKTYLASDVAYLKNKFSRGFKKVIYIWGADHAGYIQRMKAAAQALGHTPEEIKIIIVQLARLIEKGQEVRMSKRRGVYVLLEDLIGEIGLDAIRFFFLMRSADSHFNFDLGLAKEQSQKNPVYYVQYAYARLRSIQRKAKTLRAAVKISDLKFLTQTDELALARQLIRWPEIIEDTAGDYQVQRLPQYALDLVAIFHKFYEECRVISDDKKLTAARLALVRATQIVLKNVLDLMGLAAPEKM